MIIPTESKKLSRFLEVALLTIFKSDAKGSFKSRYLWTSIVYHGSEVHGQLLETNHGSACCLQETLLHL